jgi:hypothetical protein
MQLACSTERIGWCAGFPKLKLSRLLPVDQSWLFLESAFSVPSGPVFALSLWFNRGVLVLGISFRRTRGQRSRSRIFSCWQDRSMLGLGGDYCKQLLDQVTDFSLVTTERCNTCFCHPTPRRPAAKTIQRSFSIHYKKMFGCTLPPILREERESSWAYLESDAKRIRLRKDVFTPISDHLDRVRFPLVLINRRWINGFLATDSQRSSWVRDINSHLPCMMPRYKLCRWPANLYSQ